MKQSIKITGAFFFILGSGLPVSAQLNPLSIGTIHPGDSIVIRYDATINNPLPPGTSQIINQGTISGGNFGTVQTDDPDTGPGGDATITLLNIFPLPVTLTTLSATAVATGTELSWSVTAEYDLEKYVVEKGIDGRHFTYLGEIAARNSPGEWTYHFLDGQPSGNDNYYRLRIVDKDGTIRYSQVVRVSSKGLRLITTYPNPVVNNSFALQLQKVPRGMYKLDIYNNLGALVYSRSFDHTGELSTRVFALGSMAQGVYHLSLTGENIRFSQKLLVGNR